LSYKCRISSGIQCRGWNPLKKKILWVFVEKQVGYVGRYTKKKVSYDLNKFRSLYLITSGILDILFLRSLLCWNLDDNDWNGLLSMPGLQLLILIAIVFAVFSQEI